MGNMKKNTTIRNMARGWIDGDNLMVQYADYTTPWETPIVLREATDADREMFGTQVPWARREYGGMVIPERDPSEKA